MKKLLLIIGTFLFSWEINAAVVPEIWHRPDSFVTTRRSRVQAVENAQKVVDNMGHQQRKPILLLLQKELKSF